MKELVEKLCSDACAGRAAGSVGGARARSIISHALESAGLEPIEQHVPAFGGANVLASLQGPRSSTTAHRAAVCSSRRSMERSHLTSSPR